MAPKRSRKRDEGEQLQLEETTGTKPMTKSTKVGKAQAEVKDSAPDLSQEELVRRKMAKKHGSDSVQAQGQSKMGKEKEEGAAPSASDSAVWVNRAPTLTLWASIVAQRQGFSRAAGNTFGKQIAGITAHSKGVSIGTIERKEKDPAEERRKTEQEEEAGVEKVDVFGMRLKAVDVDGEMHAIETDGKPIDPAKVDKYFERAFGARLGDVERAMQALAEAHTPEDIGAEAYGLYEQFRPSIPSGQQGWGKKGLLDLSHIKQLAKRED